MYYLSNVVRTPVSDRYIMQEQHLSATRRTEENYSILKQTHQFAHYTYQAVKESIKK